MVRKVHLLPNVRRKLEQALHEQVQSELGQVFRNATEVTAYDLIEGFSHDPQRKIILAVQTRTQPKASKSQSARPLEFQSHIVKLGHGDVVAADVHGWEQATKGRAVSARMFVPVELRVLHSAPPDPPRAAAIYLDASQWYGMLTPKEEVATLEWAVHAAVFENSMQLSSVERAIRQVFRELGRWFYHTAKEDGAKTARFYRAKLRLPDKERKAINRWTEGELWELRRDAVSLLCGYHAPDNPRLPDFLDPYDFARWVLETDHVPTTLSGCSHGDLHARNVLVGSTDDEVEYPLLIDYGDMADDNVLAWDFAKMETELKVRLLSDLFTDLAAQQELWDRVEQPHFPALIDRWKAGVSDERLGIRTQLLLFAFEFERLLAERTAEFLRSPSGAGARLSPHPSPLVKAVSILLRIRYEAVLQLGEHRRRQAAWQDEYYFALAVYGLNTAKFDDAAYHIYHRLFALVSAGVAAAQVHSTRKLIESLIQADPPPPGPYPSYVVPVYHAYTRWKKRKESDVAEKLLADVVDTFDYAVPLRRELSLLQATLGRRDDALVDLEQITLPRGAPRPRLTQKRLIEWFRAFVEIEVPSRMGRIFKDKADSLWEQLNVSHEELMGRAPAQFYRSAFRYYYEAFKLSGNYYPGGNAAVTALLAGERAEARRIASEVQAACTRIDLGSLTDSDRYWVLVTEGDTALIQGDLLRAADYFRNAFCELPAGNDGLVQSSYVQLCRLHKALGEHVVRPVLEVFRETKKFRLGPGPLGDCGSSFNETNHTSNI